MDPYRAFLEAKVQLARSDGFEVAEHELSPWLKPHAKLAVQWALRGGRRAIFASFGLHKTSMQLEACRLALAHLARRDGARRHRALIVIPLGVKQEFDRDAAPERLNLAADPCGAPRFVRSTLECWGPGLYLTNYETFREGLIDLSGFEVVCLDEAACLRGMGGTKTFRVAANQLKHVPFRFVATATPSPNEYIELLAYAEVLDVMDIGQAKTRFFRRNSEKADQLTLHPHKEREFWLWVASWALYIQTPADLGCDDAGYVLPPLKVTWHEVPLAAPDWDAGGAPGGQGQLFRSTRIGVATQAKEKRASLVARVAKLAEICRADPAAHRLLWHDLNDEAALIAQAMPEAFVLTGDQLDEVKEARLIGFSDGAFQYLAAKPVMAGAGCNFQRHCRKAVFVGIGFKFHDFIQAIHRIYRFGQAGVVEIDVIYAESEREVRAELERKWSQHNEMVAKMAEIIREYGLSAAAMADVLRRSLGVERVEAFGKGWTGEPASSGPDPLAGAAWKMVHEDCVNETRRMPDACVDLVVTSIPFSTQYEYSPNYADFGHTESNEHFFQQMDFLLPELFRIVKPGRNVCIHVKDRVVPGGVNGLGFQTLYPFGDDVRAAMRKHGFAYLGYHENSTDVVRENNQTYRLSYSEQLKDGTRMGSGVGEQVLVFRKPPSDLTNGYADTPVVKPRPAYAWVEGENAGQIAPYDRKLEKAGLIRQVPQSRGFSLAKWQMVASGLWKSSGDRLLTPEEWVDFTSERLSAAWKLWKAHDLGHVYDFEQHVLIAEKFHYAGVLPTKYQLLRAHSADPHVWTDVAQMRSLNTVAAQQKRDKHLCPLPFDIVDRLIEQRSMPGELVFDPFAGVGTVPYCALKLGRRGLGVELSADYFPDAVFHCGSAEEAGRKVPTLFDAIEAGLIEEPEEIAA
jgi:DNA modification methylase